MRPYGFAGIQLKQQISHKSRVDWELNIFTVMVLQLRAVGPPWSIICAEDRGKESIKHLCLAPVPLCEVTILILQWASVISNLPFAINIFEKTIFYCPLQFWPVSPPADLWPHGFSPYSGSSISVFFPCHLTLLPLGKHLPFSSYFQEKFRVQPRKGRWCECLKH